MGFNPGMGSPDRGFRAPGATGFVAATLLAELFAGSASTFHMLLGS